MTPGELARFEAKFSPEPNTGCWLWFGASISKGYGYFNADGKTRRAHRVAFEHFNRPLIGDEIVCHHCDQPACVNPDHLFAGSHLSNAQDRDAKGRRANSVPPVRRGVDMRMSKLSEADVLVIRATHKRAKLYRGVSPTSMNGLALKFGVACSTINAIIQRATWRHI